ncbi:MAG: hypothetical protein U0736_04025 [Gemmataceae bacterium]
MSSSAIAPASWKGCNPISTQGFYSMRGTWFVGLIAFAAGPVLPGSGRRGLPGKRYAVLVGVKGTTTPGCRRSVTQKAVEKAGRGDASDVSALPLAVTVLSTARRRHRRGCRPEEHPFRLMDVLGPCKRDDLVLVAFADHEEPGPQLAVQSRPRIFSTLPPL